MDIDIDKLFQPLQIVDNETIGNLGEKLRKSKKREEQAIGTFLLRVSVMREEGGGSTRTRNPKTNSGIDYNHGLTHLKD